ncbi:MAG: phage tail protein [Chloroflexota bacterium]|nr:phage tail protein [Chloroflexota bacterium]
MSKKFIGGFVAGLLMVGVLVAALVAFDIRGTSAGPGAAAPAAPAVAPLGGTERATDGFPTERFRVEIDGIADSSSFWYLGGLDMKTDVVTTLMAGATREAKNPGRNHYAPNGLVLRGPWLEATGGMRDWYTSTLDGAVERKSMSIIILDRAGNEVARYNLFEAWPSAYSLSTMGDATQLGCANCPPTILQETFVIQAEWIQQG